MFRLKLVSQLPSMKPFNCAYYWLYNQRQGSCYQMGNAVPHLSAHEVIEVVWLVVEWFGMSNEAKTLIVKHSYTHSWFHTKQRMSC